jgi:uncharacterized protein (TIGR02145 family)
MGFLKRNAFLAAALLPLLSCVWSSGEGEKSAEMVYCQFSGGDCKHMSQHVCGESRGDVMDECPLSSSSVRSSSGVRSSSSAVQSSGSRLSSSSLVSLPSSSGSVVSSSSSIVSSSSAALSSATQSSSSSIRSSSSVVSSSSSYVLSSSAKSSSSSVSGGYIGSYGSVSHGGKSYKTVVIGTQTWMAENLNVMHNSGNGESWCYGGQESNCNTYGRLYNWAAAMNLTSSCNSSSCASQVESKHQGLCPSGWHIPTDGEWSTLENNVGGSDTAGKYLKSTSGWNSDGNGLDTYGFSALPGGFRITGGSFFSAGDNGSWWSSSEYTALGAYYRSMVYNDGNAYWGHYGKANGFSVRCVQDNAP